MLELGAHALAMRPVAMIEMIAEILLLTWVMVFFLSLEFAANQYSRPGQAQLPSAPVRTRHHKPRLGIAVLTQIKHSFRVMRLTCNLLVPLRETTRLGLLALALSAVACSTQPPAVNVSAVNYEGLAEVSRPYFDIAQVRPETVFSEYDGVILNAPELAFRAPDRSQKQFPLDESQKQRFQDLLAAAFSLELSNLQNLELRDQPGPGVLELTIRVENITATVPSGKSMRVGFALTAVGEATLILELSDSQSEQILARGVETRAVQGAALGQGGSMVTRWEEVEKLCSQWASMARSRLDVLVDQG